MTFDRQILEKLGELDEVIEDVQDIAEENYSNRMHVDPEYDASDDALRAYVNNLRYDEETAEKVYDDLKDTGYSSEELKDVFIEHTDIDPREISPVNRRQFIKATGAIMGGSYALDAGYNQHLLEEADQARFEAPAGSYYEPAVEDILEGGQMDVHVFNIYLGEEDNPNYNKERISREVEGYLDELEDVDPNLSIHDVNITPEIISEELFVSESFAESAFENFEDNLNKTGVMEAYPSFIGGYMDDLVDYDEHNITEDSIKVGVADFRDSDFSGVSKSNEFTGKKDWAFASRRSEKELIETLTHELGHKMGLPHTKYPDPKRKGLFPDIMSYSDGTVSIPNAVHSTADQSAFGRQSHYNWEQVKELVEQKSKT